MSAIYTPTPAQQTTYTDPVDGDDLDVASVDAFLQGLADGLAWHESTRFGAVHRVEMGNVLKINDMAFNAGGILQGTVVTAPAITMRIDPHDGATLVGATLYFKIAAGHGAVPAVPPKLSIFRRNVLTGAAGQVLASTDGGGGLAITSVVSVVLYEQGSAVVSFSYPLDQNKVIDKTTYVYAAYIADENGANSQTGNLFYGIDFEVDAIPDMRRA